MGINSYWLTVDIGPFFSNIGYYGAVFFLTLYYLSHPPLLNAEYILPAGGSYLWIEKKSYYNICSSGTDAFSNIKNNWF